MHCHSAGWKHCRARHWHSWIEASHRRRVTFATGCLPCWPCQVIHWNQRRDVFKLKLRIIDWTVLSSSKGCLLLAPPASSQSITGRVSVRTENRKIRVYIEEKTPSATLVSDLLTDPKWQVLTNTEVRRQKLFQKTLSIHLSGAKLTGKNSQVPISLEKWTWCFRVYAKQSLTKFIKIRKLPFSICKFTYILPSFFSIPIFRKLNRDV